MLDDFGIFTALDCIAAMWLAVEVYKALTMARVLFTIGYNSVDHGGTPSVQIRSAELGRAALVLGRVAGISAILETEEQGQYLCVHETPEHRAQAIARVTL